MAIKSGFFNSVNGDRLYDADDIGNYFEGLISNGVFENVENRLVVTAGDGMSVNVATGRAFINCHWLKNDAILNLVLDSADVQYKRIDRIVVRLDISDNERAMNIYVLKGTNAFNPIAPVLTRDETVYEICLADILINPNVSSITQSNITDQRTNTSVCGFVTGLIDQVDTTDLFIQYQDEFQSYYDRVTTEFDAYMEQKKAAVESWYNDLIASSNVNVNLVKYQNSVTSMQETDAFSIGIPEYTEKDILLVHINGVLFVEGQEYSVTGEGENAQIKLTNSITADNTITFICIKSVVGNISPNN